MNASGKAYQWIPEQDQLAAVEMEGGSAEIVTYDLETGVRCVLIDASLLASATGGHTIQSHVWTASGSHLVPLVNSPGGPVASCILDTKAKLSRPLRHSAVKGIAFSPDSRYVSYVHDNDIWIESLSEGKLQRITLDGSADIQNGLVDLSVDASFAIGAAPAWSPDSKRIAFFRCDLTHVSRNVVVDRSAGARPEEKVYPYPKPGGRIPSCSLGIFELESRTTFFADPSWRHDIAYLTRLLWRGDGRTVYVQALNRSQNRLAIFSVNCIDATAELVIENSDEMWVEAEDFHIFSDGSCALMSEHDGWRRLYHVHQGSDEWKPLSPPGMDVGAIRYISTDLKRIYLEGSPHSAVTNRLYMITLADDELIADELTPSKFHGWNTYQISRSGRWSCHEHSSSRQSLSRQIVDLGDHSPKVSLPPHHHDAMPESLDIEFFQVLVAENVELDACLVFPPAFDTALKYPLLLYVYGGPAKAIVRDEWTEHLSQFHHRMAQDGFLVLSVDNRGTPAPRGRMWRKFVFGQQDVIALRDQAAAVRRLLEARPYIDRSRLAVWGHSAGGSATLHLMFREPGLFKVGVSSAPVVDRRYYCAPFQERFLGVPEENAEAYHQGSNINFADGLTGHLLLVHGTHDINVHPGMTEALSKRLINLGKTFYAVNYPGRGHELMGTESNHYFQTIGDFIRDHCR